MNENKTAKLKEIVSKINLKKILYYSIDFPKSETLRKINIYSKRVLNSKNDQEVFRLAVKLGYYSYNLVNLVKCVKNEAEK